MQAQGPPGSWLPWFRAVFRQLLIAGLLAAPLAAPAAAQPQELIPGLTYDRRIEFTTAGPVVANVLTIPRPGGLWKVQPVLSTETIPGTERLTAMERRLSPAATVAGVNGDLFGANGAPSGIVMRNGGLDQPPLPARSSIGIDSSGALTVARVTMLATWQGTGPRRALAEINAVPAPNMVSLFTPAWGPATPSVSGSVQVALAPFPVATPNVELSAPVTAVASGSTAIPAGGAVIVARGTAAARLQAEAPVGGTVRVRLILKPAWSAVQSAIGGGPVLVRAGKPVFRANEDFTPDQLLLRTARTAVGQLADGRILLVAVDGAQPGWSAGVTNFELALLMVKLGAVTAAALDDGGSTAMAFDGRLLSRPTGPEKPIADALTVSYGGVYVPPPLEPVLSPNGDGIAEKQQLSYKLVRQSNVTANLLGPDGVPRFTFSGPQPPGIYPLDWSGTKPDGTPELEGLWRWTVTATDDLGQVSSAERDFQLNRTLGFPTPVTPALAVPRAEPRSVAVFKLSRAATVTSRIETTSGVVLRTLPKQQAAAGSLDVSWDGKTDTGGLAYSGRYVAEVTATNELGSVTLGATFSVRRLPPPPPPKKPPPKKKPPAKKK